MVYNGFMASYESIDASPSSTALTKTPDSKSHTPGIVHNAEASNSEPHCLSILTEAHEEAQKALASMNDELSYLTSEAMKNLTSINAGWSSRLESETKNAIAAMMDNIKPDIAFSQSMLDNLKEEANLIAQAHANQLILPEHFFIDATDQVRQASDALSQLFTSPVGKTALDNFAIVRNSLIDTVNSARFTSNLFSGLQLPQINNDITNALSLLQEHLNSFKVDLPSFDAFLAQP